VLVGGYSGETEEQQDNDGLEVTKKDRLELLFGLAGTPNKAEVVVRHRKPKCREMTHWKGLSYEEANETTHSQEKPSVVYGALGRHSDLGGFDGFCSTGVERVVPR